jgi:pimeloyl-ACP methyl ester carboxylesterase
MIRQGKGPPLVLFHGILGGERMWQRVIPLVAPYHDAIAVTALGHNGGNRPTRRPARIADVVDDAEQTLDDLHISTAHLAGNSMGGWVALELARRGRALSVCGLSPAGCWTVGQSDPKQAGDSLRATIRQARLGRSILPLLARSPRFRRWAMQLNAVHGDRMAADEMVAATDDLLGCEVGEDLLRTGEALAPFAALPCPVTIAWSERDRVLPMRTHGERAKQMMPGARFVVLKDVGHVPMFDDPELVARTLLESTGASPTPA